jgi:hypothetical protein
MAGPSSYMCGSSMGMVFCPADYSSNGGAGFSLIFKSWVINSKTSYALACVGVLFLGVARQLVVGLRARLNELGRQQNCGREEPLLADRDRVAPWVLRKPTYVALADITLFALGSFISYLNMLVAMAYDFGLLLSLVAGEALTYGALALFAGVKEDKQRVQTEDMCCS